MDDAVEVLLALTEAHLSQSAVYAARCEQRGGYLDAPSREVLRAHQFAHRAAANKLLSRAKELQTAAGVPVRGVWPDEVDAAALRSIESDVRHLVDAKLPDYQPAAGALRGLQLLMERHGIARNVGGRLVPPGVASVEAPSQPRPLDEVPEYRHPLHHRPDIPGVNPSDGGRDGKA